MLSVDINLLWTVINILFLCLLIRIFLFKPVHKILEARQATIEKDLADAQKAREDAEALAESQRAFVSEMDAERQKAMDESTKNAMRVYDEIIASANAQAADIVHNAEIEGQQQKDAIMREAHGEIRDLVLEATARVVGIQSGNDSALYDQFLQKVGEGNDESNT